MVFVSVVLVIRWTPSLIFYLLTPDVKSDLTFLDAVYILRLCATGISVRLRQPVHLSMRRQVQSSQTRTGTFDYMEEVTVSG